MEIFERPDNREDSSGRKFVRIDRSTKNFHLKKFSAPLGFKKDGFEIFFVVELLFPCSFGVRSRELLFEYLSLT